jgi:integrase
LGERLNDRIVAKLIQPPVGSRIYFDSEVGGLGVRVTCAGAKSFILDYRNRTGRQRRITIGSTGDWTVTAARLEARELRHQIDTGHDPLAERRAIREAPTVADLCQRFLTEHLRSKAAATQSNYAAAIKNVVLPRLGRLKVAEVAFEDISALHRAVSQTAPIQANRIVAQLSSMFSLAIRWKWRTDNPVKGVELNHEEGRERYLRPDELSRLAAALDSSPDKQAANAIALLLLTGSRVSEVLTMRWQDVDLEAAIWIKPSQHTKQKRTHRLPLSAPARELLARLRAASDDTGYVFPGTGGTGRRRDIKAAWWRICERAGIENCRLHDLRHTHASLLVSAGFSLPVIGRLLGHTQPRTTARYAHLADDPLRIATEAVGQIISNGNRRQ